MGQRGRPRTAGRGLAGKRAGMELHFVLRHASGVTLLLYGATDFVEPLFQLQLNPLKNKTARVWHCLVPQQLAPAARYYSYRVQGPWNPPVGHRFDADKVLFDPYAEQLFFPPEFSREAARQPGRNDGRAILGVLPRTEQPFDWGGTPPLRHTHDAVVYELHVKGFTARANSGVPPAKRGTFAGVDREDSLPAGTGRHGRRAAARPPVRSAGGQLLGLHDAALLLAPSAVRHGEAFAEFRQMVRAFHAAGIEVWLDVVYNHTAEGDETGPTYSYRGIDNHSYYLLTPDRRRYLNDTGCGNTMRGGASPGTRVLVLEACVSGRARMGVDGFRFDLASIFSRDADGTINARVAGDRELESDRGALMFDVRLVAEAWDITSLLNSAAGFPGIAWLQWNGQFRDDRAFVCARRAGQGGRLDAAALRQRRLFPDGPGDAIVRIRASTSSPLMTGSASTTWWPTTKNTTRPTVRQHATGTDDNRSWNCGWEGDDGAPPEAYWLCAGSR